MPDLIKKLNKNFMKKHERAHIKGLGEHRSKVGRRTPHKLFLTDLFLLTTHLSYTLYTCGAGVCLEFSYYKKAP